MGESDGCLHRLVQRIEHSRTAHRVAVAMADLSSAGQVALLAKEPGGLTRPFMLNGATDSRTFY